MLQVVNKTHVLSEHAFIELNILRYNQQIDSYTFNILCETIDKLCDNLIKHSAPIDTRIGDMLTKLLSFKPLSNIDLNRDNFIVGKNNELTHKRCYYIKWNEIGIYNDNAFDIDVTEDYNIPLNCKEKISLDGGNYNQNRVYLTAGGVITGKYINKCYILDNQKDHPSYIVYDTITLKCKKLQIDIKNSIFCIDHRDVNLNLLKKVYNLDIKYDDNIKHIDFRKLNKTLIKL